MEQNSRRKLLKTLAAGSGAVVAGMTLPDNWTRPVIDSVTLPAHAQTSPPACDAIMVFESSTLGTTPMPPGISVPQGSGDVSTLRFYTPTAGTFDAKLEFFVDGVLVLTPFTGALPLPAGESQIFATYPILYVGTVAVRVTVGCTVAQAWYQSTPIGQQPNSAVSSADFAGRVSIQAR